MSFLFGGGQQVKKDPVRDYLKELRHATRSMDREEMKAIGQEKVLVSGITKLAREQRIDLCKIKARDLVRLRAHRNRLMTMKGHMTTLQNQLSTVQSAKVMQETIAQTTKLLRGLNQKLDAKSVHKMLIEFERQNSEFSDGQVILEESLDNMFELENEQAETEQAVCSIFQELGLETQIELKMAASHSTHCVPSEEELMKRLMQLKPQS